MELTREQIDALENAKPKPPRIYELGGDYYYRCYWIACDELLTKWNNYCPKCGQKIDWEGVDR